MKEKQNKTKQETHEMEQVTFQICPQLNEDNVRQVKIKGKLSPFIFVFNVERTQPKRWIYQLVPEPPDKNKAQSPSSFVPRLLFAAVLSKVNENWLSMCI